MSLTKDETSELELLLEQELKAQAKDCLLHFTRFTKHDYQVNWHHRVVCEKLDRFVHGDLDRLMLFMPPRYGKSELVSRRLPAFILGHRPDASIIATAYGADLASRNNRDVQRIMDADEYRELFPNTRLFGKNTRTMADGSWLRNSDIFEVVGHRGTYRSAGIGGGITGMGADFALIDDPIKSQEEADSAVYRARVYDWYNSVLYTRLEKGGKILLTMTRWHEDDLAGRLAELSTSDMGADQWEVVSFPAINESQDNPDDPRSTGDPLWPDKFPMDRLEQTRKTVGSRVWNSLFQQRPSAPEGAIIKRHWFKFYKERPDKFDEIIQSWDMTFKDSKKSDFVVCEVWGRIGADKFLLDLVRDRLDFPATVNAFLSVTEKWPKAIVKLVEDKANGPAIIALLKQKVPGIIPYSPTTSKEGRLNAVSPEIEAGNVYLPDPMTAPWVGDFIEEVCHFPKGKNDDQVDAMSQALIRFQSKSKPVMNVLPVSLTKTSSWRL